MPRFFLLDPWLANAKGHNYQYALDVAGAAQECGYEPVLAIHRKTSVEATFPSNWNVVKLFEHGECPRHWLSLDGRNPFPYDLAGAWLPDPGIRWWQRILDLPARYDRLRRLRGFAKCCQKLFSKLPARPDDILYLPSLSEFDFLCAVRFWREAEWTRSHDWHLQFHFNFFRGRDPDYREQTEVLGRFQRLFREAVDQVPEHRLHFYATTEAMARQYDALNLAIFRPLPYPVRPLARNSDASSSESIHRPLRATLPGAMRREKGKKRLGPLIESVWDDLLQPGRLQLVFQASPSQIQHWLPRQLRQLRQTVRVPPAGVSDPQAPLLAAPHPLDAHQYTEFIRSSDIGLLVYDSKRYFARASGVLCEMLSAGVPVIVPAGCWLADQLAEENYCHVDQLWRQQGIHAEPLTIAGNSERIELPAYARTLLIRFNWPHGTPPGIYGELIAESLDEQSHAGSNAAQREILGARKGGPAGVVIRFPNPVRRLSLSLRNAFASTPLLTPDFQILDCSSMSNVAEPPLGSVGLIAADEQEIPRLLREMTTNYGHYARTAQRFAKVWQVQHAPTHTVSQLAARGHARESRRLSAA